MCVVGILVTVAPPAPLKICPFLERCGPDGRDGSAILPAEVTMRYRPFGRTGLQVSVVGFGCWPMAGDRYGAIEDDEAVKAIHRALDRGVNCVDTAPAYGAGHSEEVVARALETRRS